MKSTNSRAEAQLYYEGGDVNKVVRSPDDLIAAVTEWENSWQAKPKPYAALLLPWTIANGPQPPNAEDLEHQRDVLKTCATLRSDVLDRLNILEFMINPEHTSYFLMKPGDAERLAKLQDAVSSDYDVIMKTASFALDHAKDAVEPKTFAQTKMQPPIPNFELTAFSAADLPKRVDGLPVTLPVPDLRGLVRLKTIKMKRTSHPSGIDPNKFKPLRGIRMKK